MAIPLAVILGGSKMKKKRTNEAKEYLLQAKNANKKIYQYNLILEQLKMDYGKLTASYGDMTGHTNQKHDTSDYITMLLAQEEKINKMKAQYLEKKNEITDFIMSLDFDVEDEKLRELLILKYINFKSFDEIHVIMNYSYSHLVQNMHPRALRAVNKRLKECSRL